MNALFNDAAEPSAAELTGRLATTRTSTGSVESFQWVSAFSRMFEWDGEREMMDVAVSEFDVEPRHFEASVKFSRDKLADENNLGAITDAIQSRVRAFPQEREYLMAERLAKGFTQPSMYDGADSFFGTNHPVYEWDGDAGETVAVEAEYANVPLNDSGNADLFDLAANLKTADRIVDEIERMNTFRSLNGVIIGVEPNLMIVPPTRRKEAQKLVNNDEILDESAGEMRPNPLSSIIDEVYVEPRLTAHGMDAGFIVADTDTQGLHPAIYLLRQDLRTESAGPNSDFAAINNEVVYGSDARFEIFLGSPQAFIGSDGSNGTL
jgi:phage major head subunit gpT-like protein